MWHIHDKRLHFHTQTLAFYFLPFRLKKKTKKVASTHGDKHSPTNLNSQIFNNGLNCVEV